MSFLLHNISAAESLIRLNESFGSEWFPVTVGYAIVRPMFEIDVTAHYISQSPSVRAHQYIEFGSVLRYNKMQAVKKHQNSREPSWKEAMEMVWKHEYLEKEPCILQRYEAVLPNFSSTSSKGRIIPFHNWSGLKLREMAAAVKHEESYDIFYSDLSSFTHADVSLADRFLKFDNDGLVWSMRANELDVGFVFRYATIFLSCFLTLFGKQFGTWKEKDVIVCRDFRDKN
ncbi:MAG: DUF5677 domain-containing protein [Candidatus Altiarchaeota archaeon]|nr:DUF5677 domain-containing protein [Candidatus Altiarchaeota archaeon]